MAVAVTLACGAAASWYWPFGSSDDSSRTPPRLSELMEPASRLIDEASDLASDGKIQDSVEKYREALAELDRIEAENPDRAASQEFATVRNKRAYVNAAIDSLLLGQVRENAKAVAVSDTTELEKRLAAEKSAARGGEKPAPEPARDRAAAPRETPVSPPRSQREAALTAMDAGDFATAEAIVEKMLSDRPNGAMALNLKASIEAAQGRLKDAERTLDQAIMSNPRSHYAYYNMASLLLQADSGNKSSARRYYETGRAVGGPVDGQLEESLK